MDLSWTDVEFTPHEEKYLKPLVDEAMHTQLGVKADGYMFAPSFKSGHWDGIIPFYEIANQRFPTGLLEEVEAILGKLQGQYSFQYEVVDNRPEKLLRLSDVPKEIKLNMENVGEVSLRDYQQEAVESIIEHQSGILNISTNGGKTLTSAGIISLIRPLLVRGETIAFFTVSSSIFTQTAKRLEEHLGIEIGRYGLGKKDIKQVNVVMVPTINSALKSDPEKGLKLTAKEGIIKKMAKVVAPMFLEGVNQRQMMKAYLMNFEPKTKADENFMEEIEKVIEKSESDAKAKFHLNSYVVKYDKILKTKNKKAYEKKLEVTEFLESITAFISDEHQHLTSDSLYNTLLACTNAIYRVGLTGSIDLKNKMLLRRLKAVTGEITVKTSNEFLIEEGHSAKPKITFAPIYNVEQNGRIVNIQNENNYMNVYDSGVVKNEYRNLLIAKITQMCYANNQGVLIIVSRIEHGESIGELLTGMDINFEFLRGEIDIEERDARLDEMRAGTLKVVIATSILDEGVDVSGIDALIMGAGGKSFRQTLQRVGRALRKKKEGENVTHIYDFADRTNKYLYRHYQAREKIYQDENFEINYLE